MNSLAFITANFREMLYTVGLALTLFSLGSAAAWVMSRKQNRETQRFWALTFRHLAAIGFMLGLVVIWKTELQSVFLALGAATAGFLLAFREHWLSLLAFWIRVVKRQYNLNDFIEVDGVRGRVIDITWLTTVVAESVPDREGTVYSGKVVHIPNNRMLLSNLTVDNLTDEYTLHIVTLPLPLGAQPLAAEKILLSVAHHHCEQYIPEARKHIQRLVHEKALDIASVEPRVFLSVAEEGAVTLRLRMMVPQAECGHLHQAILYDFFKQATEEAWPLNRSGH